MNFSVYSTFNITTTIVTIKYIIHIGTSVSWETVQSIQSNSFKAWNWTINGDNFTGYIYDGTNLVSRKHMIYFTKIKCDAMCRNALLRSRLIFYYKHNKF